MDNYKEMRGFVGNYQGVDIFVIDEENFNVSMSKKQDIHFFYAIVIPDKENLLLINRGMEVGELTPQGEVHLYDRSRFYEKTMKGNEVSTPAITTASGIDPLEEYKAGEDLTDRFLRGFNDW